MLYKKQVVPTDERTSVPDVQHGVVPLPEDYSTKKCASRILYRLGARLMIAAVMPYDLSLAARIVLCYDQNIHWCGNAKKKSKLLFPAGLIIYD